MGSNDERAFEAVILANTFLDPRGRAFIEEFFPPSVVELYDAVVARPDWQSAATLTERAFIVIAAFEEDPDLDARYRADVEAGLLGFGAGEDERIDVAIGEVLDALGRSMTESAGPDDWLLGGGPSESWSPLAPIDAESAEPPTGEIPTANERPAPDGEDAETAEEPPTTVQTWLNAEVQGDDEVLAAQTEYVLAVFFGDKSDTSFGGNAPTAIGFSSGQKWVDLNVQLVSTDFTVPPFPQRLRVGRDGASRGRALFPVIPLHEGPSTLSVLVDVEGNFLQRLELAFDIGTTTPVDMTNFGRPAGAALVMEPRTASMQFMPATGGYELFVKGVTEEPVFVQITADELAARIEGVREVLLAIVKQPAFALEIDIPEELRAPALKQLAFAGFRLYQSIFAGSFASDELKKVGRWLRESLAEDFTTLQVVSRGFPVPWALMYLTDRFADDKLDWNDFIGMRHVVEQVPLREISAMPPATTIASTPDLSVRVLFNEGIEAQMPSRPISAQRRYWSHRGVALGEGTLVDDLVNNALAPSATDKVLYLYCHAVASDKDSDDSYLVLSNEERISLGQLAVYAPIEDQLPTHPLVIINACESGDLSPTFYDGFVPYFLAKGARGVIGTECKTPGRFASEWAIAFFDRFFAGERLGDAVLGLRQEFLEKHGNPLGLLYGVHCDTDTRVDPALAASGG